MRIKRNHFFFEEEIIFSKFYLVSNTMIPRQISKNDVPQTLWSRDYTPRALRGIVSAIKWDRTQNCFQRADRQFEMAGEWSMAEGF